MWIKKAVFFNAENLFLTIWHPRVRDLFIVGVTVTRSPAFPAHTQLLFAPHLPVRLASGRHAETWADWCEDGAFDDTISRLAKQSGVSIVSGVYPARSLLSHRLQNPLPSRLFECWTKTPLSLFSPEHL